MLFARIDDAAIARLEEAGLVFYAMGPGLIRLVTSWQTTLDDIERALEAFDRALT
jgi:threonine aldolase